MREESCPAEIPLLALLPCHRFWLQLNGSLRMNEGGSIRLQMVIDENGQLWNEQNRPDCAYPCQASPGRGLHMNTAVSIQNALTANRSEVASIRLNTATRVQTSGLGIARIIDALAGALSACRRSFAPLQWFPNGIPTHKEAAVMRLEGTAAKAASWESSS